MSADNLIASRCPRCKTKRDLHYVVDGTGEPVEGDVLVCVCCGFVSKFWRTQLVALTISERAALPLHRQRAINRIVGIVQRLDDA